ncbi:MAG TPA: LuxR C-terminal-related transcriptional regulator [Solirubrobacteraceae bacterium]|jgi:DNA-binding CsgD family transcriptional regulator
MSGVGRVTPAAGRFIAGEQRVAVLWRTVLDALFVLDDDRMLIRVNGHAGELLRAPVDDIVGRRIDEFVAQTSWPLVEDLWERLMLDGALRFWPFELLRADKSSVLVEFHATRDFATGQHLVAARATDAPPARRFDPSVLSAREREVLQLAATGHSTSEIAELLVLSPGTVKTHLQRIFGKLDVRDRAAAVAEGIRRGLIA